MLNLNLKPIYIFLAVDYRLAEIYILTSSIPSPESPSTYSSDWINRFYRNEPYGDVGTIHLNPQISAQHVAVVSVLTNAPLSLAEVIIYGMLILSMLVFHHEYYKIALVCNRF